MVSAYEIVIGVFTIMMGAAAIYLVIKARQGFKSGMINDTLRRYFYSLTVLTCFSLWHTLREYFHWKETIGEFMEYPEYIFITFAYLGFVITAYQMYKISRPHKLK